MTKKKADLTTVLAPRVAKPQVRLRRNSDAAKSETSKPAGVVLPVRPLLVWAGPCPRAANHKHTSVYRTAGQTRYCKCNDCGHTWKQIGPLASDVAEASTNEQDDPAAA